LFLDGWIDTFDSSALPDSLNMADFQGGSISILSQPPGNTLSNYSATGEFSIDTTVVPAPSSLTVLLGVGVTVFGMEWWKKRRRRVRATA
jgi:hypothetical protein